MTGIPVYDNLSNKIRSSNDVQLADKVVHMRKNKDQWDTIEELVKAWMDRSPEEFKAFKVYIGDTREVQIDPKFATTKNQDQDRRLLLVMPRSLHDMIRSIYKPDELKMDKEFFMKFAKRFKFFKIPEKI